MTGIYIDDWFDVPVNQYTITQNICIFRIPNEGYTIFYKDDWGNIVFSSPANSDYTASDGGYTSSTNRANRYINALYNGEFIIDTNNLIVANTGNLNLNNTTILPDSNFCNEIAAIFKDRNGNPIITENQGGALYSQHIANKGTPLNCCFQNARSIPTMSNKITPSSGGNKYNQSSCGVSYPPGMTPSNADDIKNASNVFTGLYNQGQRNIASLNPDTSVIFNPPGCRDIISEYCVLEPDINKLLDRWNGTDSISDSIGTPACPLAFKSIISYSGDDKVEDVISPNVLYANGLFWANNSMATIFSKLAAEGIGISGTPNQVSYDPRVNIFFQLCKDYPGACQDALNNVCQSSTVQSLNNNPTLVKWCGCYMPDEQYSRYTDIYKVPKECSPMCNRSENIPSINNEYKAKICENNNLCVIDNINFEYSTGAGSGDISVRQICGGCGGKNASCNCIIDNDEFKLLSNDIKVQINQICGDSEYYEEVNGAFVRVPNLGNPVIEEDIKNEKINFALILLIIFLVILAIAVLGYLLF